MRRPEPAAPGALVALGGSPGLGNAADAGLRLGEAAADRGRSSDGLLEDVGVALDCDATLRGGNGELGSLGEAMVDMAGA